MSTSHITVTDQFYLDAGLDESIALLLSEFERTHPAEFSRSQLLAIACGAEPFTCIDEEMEHVRQVVTSIRGIRQQYGIPATQRIRLTVTNSPISDGCAALLEKLAHVHLIRTYKA